jgi:hypothetical protein
MSSYYAEPADGLAPLDALPWLAPAGSSHEALLDHDWSFGTASNRFLRHAGILAAMAALGGGAWLLADGIVTPDARPVQQSSILRDHTSAAPDIITTKQSAAITTRSDEDAAGPKALVEPEPSPIPGKGRTDQPRRLASMQRVTIAPVMARTPPPLPHTAAPAAAGQSLAPALAPPLQPLADSPASAATLGELQSTMEQCRAAIRALIRLGDRQRPGRSASAEEQHSYRLRQQNADAAKTYRSYLGTLGRSVRGKVSETAARQSLDKARQTLAYLDTMLADSQATQR